MKESLTREERLKSQKEIGRVFSQATLRRKGKGQKLLAVKNHFEYSRFAVVLVRKFGNAVERNRAKRLAREIYRRNKLRTEPGWDIILVLYPETDNSYPDRERQFLSLLEKTGLMHTDTNTAGDPQ